ncbi:hypothetical protein ONE63_003459 [Megalurothrips usitatus]|uniref:Uncharacterized protein n=1 Tax=Megalurothrips usitatus TaxID=439358 RepID=A0AAV7XB52_9NEOP|nr:hypothetical protein ONE63_003459 [Megalurothrips usitatus]
MANVFQFLKQKTADHAGKRAPDKLQRGVPYQCYEFLQRKSDYLDKTTNEFPMTLVVKVKEPDSALKYYVTMPLLFNNLTPEHVVQLNCAVKANKPPFIVFYGNDGARNDVLLHEHGDGKLRASLFLSVISFVC